MNKESNKKFNELIEYIEDNLCEEIDYKKLARILGVNEYTMHRIFLFVTNYTMAEYIRKRRLSMSVHDLLEGKEKIIDIAIKYGYESSQSYSRAFKTMMGFLPSEINSHKNGIKYFSMYELVDEDITDEFDYYIGKDILFDFYVISMKTSVRDCHNQAPIFWKENYHKIKGKSEYGLLEYDKKLNTEEATYYIASKENFDGAEKMTLRSCNYLVFEFDFISSEYLDDYCTKVYRTIIPNMHFELVDLPDVEEYLDNNRIKLYIPIK